jgi:adenine-specific DNA methylase
VGPESDKSGPIHPQEGIVEKGQIVVIDNLQVPDKELRCEACGRVIKPERDEKVERVTDEDGVVRVFCELNRCRQERLQVHIKAFNTRIAPEGSTPGNRG